ncbi:MAG: hypothetical protein HZB65_03085 [Candidatus Aenigmarchaeota archaeon]|nr:hypothetical protein [Candidatus Aenigmarchaeota archaeon]
MGYREITRREFMEDAARYCLGLGGAAVGYLSGCTSTGGSNSPAGTFAIPAPLANSPVRIDRLDTVIDDRIIEVGVRDTAENSTNTTKYRAELRRKEGENWVYVTQKEENISITTVNNVEYYARINFGAADGIANNTLYKITVYALNRDSFPSNNPPDIKDITAYNRMIEELYIANPQKILDMNCGFAILSPIKQS